MLEVVRDLHRFTGDADGFYAWVLSVARHRLLDARRRDAHRPFSSIAHEERRVPRSPDDPEAETLAALGFGELESSLARLTDDQRTVSRLRYVGDLPIAEVVRITGRCQGAVKQLQHRAAASMRRALDVPAPPARPWTPASSA